MSFTPMALRALDVELSADGRHVATGGGGRAREDLGRGHAESSAKAQTLRGHASPVGASRSTAREPALVTLGQEARVWDVSPAGRGEVPTLPGPQTDEHADIVFTPDGQRLVAASGREGTVRVWSVDTGSCAPPRISTRERPLLVRAVIGVDVSPDGSRIATAGADGSARIFDTDTGRQLIVIRGRHCVPRWPLPT